MGAEKRFKKGELIIKEGESTNSVFVIQSGRAKVFIQRGETRIELDELGPSGIIGDQAVFGNPKQTFNVEAISETRVIEMPVAMLKGHFEKAQPALKILTKALEDDIKRMRTQLRGIRMEMDPSPMPQKLIPKYFAILSLVANHIGKSCQIDPEMPEFKREEIKKKWPENYSEEDRLIAWSSLKVYTARMFLDSIVRMEDLLKILVKLGMATMLFEKDPDSEEMLLNEVRFHDLSTLETFGEFYQHNLYKPGRSEGIYVDPIAFQLAGALVELAKEAPVDRNGVVRLEYSKLIDDIKSNFGFELKSTHLNALEKKGLFVKRSTVEETVFMAFDKEEFAYTFRYWRLISEIDKWNKNGVINMNEDISLYRKEAAKPECPECASETAIDANFCMNCGFKLAA